MSLNWFSQGLSALEEDSEDRKEKNTGIIHCYDWNSALPINYQNTPGGETKMEVFAKQGEAACFGFHATKEKKKKKAAPRRSNHT